MKKKTQLQKAALIIVATIISCISFTCKKDTLVVNNPPASGGTSGTGSTYVNTQSFFDSNKVKSQFFTFNAAVGGTFTSSKGSIIIVPANSFVNTVGGLISGTVTLEFKDIYNKSDMILSEMPTTMWNNVILKSGGMFFIRVKQGTMTLYIEPGKHISVKQPLNSFGLDVAMKPFILAIDTFMNPAAWIAPPVDSVGAPIDSLSYMSSDYIFSLYSFNSPVDSGSWCNSDNSSYFSSYTQTTLTLMQSDTNDYGTQVFLVFPGINAMVHVYGNYLYNFPYSYAPLGLNCTIIAIGVKSQKLYYAKKDITITSNLSTSFTMTETTTSALKTLLQSLNH